MEWKRLKQSSSDYERVSKNNYSRQLNPMKRYAAETKFFADYGISRSLL
jgi:hypothetical protein